MNEDIFMKRLKERLLIEFKKQDRSGVYGYTQRSMAYNSNRIEGSTLTEKQTASMFETGTLYTDDTEVIFRTKDIEEMNGHFKMFNYIMKNIEAPLEEELIKKELQAHAHHCLRQMPLIYREVLSLYFLEERSYEEISDILRIPIGTVGTRINRAKVLMKKICQKTKK